MHGSLRWDEIHPGIRRTEAPLIHRPEHHGTCLRNRRRRRDWKIPPFAWVVLFTFGTLAEGFAKEPGDEQNLVYNLALREGVVLSGKLVRLPSPVLKDGMSLEEQHGALLRVCGSEESLKALTRDSVTAPFIIKVHDLEARDATIRWVDLWFVIRGDLAGLDPVKTAARSSGKVVEVGNMRFEDRLLTAIELATSGRTLMNGRDHSRWYSNLKARLLDRIDLESTEEVESSRSGDSLVIASRSDPAFDKAGPISNRWRRLDSDGQRGPDRPLGGSISYARIGRLVQPGGALLVEMHAAFSEPREWFQGAPILRSKFAPIAQDQIRRLRRESRKAMQSGALP